ncbi:DUF998 domain-containing protein [Dyella silvatica]|uniref:DUF998 domain-containing protein n=1 Tax=Dyella silvatica TaxID=2992128 RepID=UPI00225009B9|nr:DUF998 domain-containing protein [Dyella silvatica]
MPNNPVTQLVRSIAWLQLFAVTVFTVVCGVAQFARSDLDPIVMPLSAYLIGPGGAWVRSAYYLMTPALFGFAWAGYQVTSVARRSLLAAILFAIAAATLSPVAATVLFSGTRYENLARLIHGLAAQTTFLCLSFGMLLLSTRWRGDLRWRRGSLPGVVLAWLATAALWLQVLDRSLPRGFAQKLPIVLILLWLGWVACQWLRMASMAPQSGGELAS